MTLPPPFPATPAFTHWVKTLPLDDDLKALARRDFPGMGIAVVDLTISSRTGKTPGFISYGGAEDNVERYAGSMPKIAAMYAAYRLRERLNNAAGALAAAKAEDVIPEVEAAWKPLISTA